MTDTTIKKIDSDHSPTGPEGQTVLLEPGDSWLVPRDARHSFNILEPFTAVEATHPPAHAKGRDS